MTQYVTFQVADCLYGVDVTGVQEVLPPQPRTPSPLAPATVAGLVNLRGQVVLAVDLRARRRVVDHASGENARPLRVEERSARRADDRHARCCTCHRVEARRRIRIWSNRERACDRGGSHLGRVVGKGWGNHRPLQQRLQDGELLILIHLAEPAADHERLHRNLRA